MSKIKEVTWDPMLYKGLEQMINLVLQILKPMALHLQISAINEDGLKDFRILISILPHMRTECFPARLKHFVLSQPKSNFQMLCLFPS